MNPPLPVTLCGRPKEHLPWPDGLKDLPEYPLAEPGSLPFPCALCQEITWLGPHQQHSLKELSGAPPGFVEIVCHCCAIRVMAYRSGLGLPRNDIIQAKDYTPPPHPTPP